MYRVRKKNIARKPAIAVSWVMLEKPRPLMRKIDSGASGLRWRSALITNPTSSASAAAIAPIVRALPWRLASARRS